MQKTDSNQAMRAHRKMGSSTTLNRRYVKRPSRGTEALEASVQEAAQVTTIGQVRQQFAEGEQATQLVSETVEDLDSAVTGNAGTMTGSVGTMAGVNLVAEKDIAPAMKANARHVIQVEEVQEQVAGAMQGMQRMRGQNSQQSQLEQQIQLEGQGQSENVSLMGQQMQEGSALVPTMGATTHPLQAMAIDRMREQKTAGQRKRKSAKEIKDQEIKKALARTSRVIDKDIAKRERDQKRAKLHFGIARVMLAISCAAVAVMAIVYFVGSNMPDISMRVAAMQTGINASYPGYVPRGYSMTDLSSQDGKIVMNFKSDQEDGKFTLVEEKSSWDSTALETNFVKSEMGQDYTVMREQGLTIYVGHNDVAWVNGGVMYKIKITRGQLTKKQIQSIATSL